MRFRTWHFAAVIMFSISRLSDASEIIQPSNYHADEAQVESEVSWLALQPFKGEWRLVSAHPRFTSIPDEITEEHARLVSRRKPYTRLCWKVVGRPFN